MAATRYVFAIFAIVVLAAGLATAEDPDDDCAVAQQAFSECVSYVVGMDNTVSAQCCTALGDVRNLGQSVPLRRALCRCIHSEMLAAGQMDNSRASELPGACKVQVGFIPTSPEFDCSK